MAFVLANRVLETTTTTGTGAVTLGGTSTGFQSFSAVGNGNVTFYTITNDIDWEVGVGTYFSSGPTLTREEVYESSNNNQLVNWGSGEKQVFVTYPASQAVFTLPQNVVLAGAVSGSGAVGAAGVPQFLDVEYLVVAGGGGGGAGVLNSTNAGGGGAGGFRTGTASALSTDTSYVITVGAGGPDSTSGNNSVFNAITSNGGGNGAGAGSAGAGGSGGGGKTNLSGAAGNTPSTSPSQGNNGGSGSGSPRFPGGGGGGSGGVGANASGTTGGNGGPGTASSISGASLTYAGGGGGGVSSPGVAGSGGSGGGGAGSVTGVATAGTSNTGGGGGGSTNAGSAAGAAGGSGVVILKYADTLTISNPGGGLTFTTSTAVSGFKITTFTAGTGNIQFS